MDLQWDPKIGPATIVGLLGSFGILIAGGIAWGSLTAKVESVSEVKATVEQMNRHAVNRDQKVAEQAERIGKIETSVGFIVPALTRIEAKLDSAVK